MGKQLQVASGVELKEDGASFPAPSPEHTYPSHTTLVLSS